MQQPGILYGLNLTLMSVPLFQLRTPLISEAAKQVLAPKRKVFNVFRLRAGVSC
jgi:hypothetical protein